MFAIEELPDLLARIDAAGEDEQVLLLRYVDALFAELAYHHVPTWEIDYAQERAKVVPSFAFRRLVATGRGLDATVALGGDDFPSFAIITRGAVVIISIQRDRVFVGIRGTVFLYDWRINLRFRLQSVGRWWGPARVHAGFAEEALRLVPLLEAVLKPYDHVREIRFSGHSLGGALAPLVAQRVVPSSPPFSVATFGAPRSGDFNAYWSQWLAPSTQVRRDGDRVPTVPPKWLGYADPPVEVRPNGTRYLEPARPSAIRETVGWVTFLGGRAHEHEIERYRHEVGAAADARRASADLTDWNRLRMAPAPR